MQFFKLSTFIYASFLLAPIAASGIPKSHLARTLPLDAELDLAAVAALSGGKRQTLPIINFNLQKTVTDILSNVSEELSKASIVNTLVKSVATQLQTSLTNIAAAVKATNVDAETEEISTSFKTIVTGLDQLATAIKDLLENETVDSLVVGSISKETVALLTTLLTNVKAAVESIDATVEQSQLVEVLTPLKDLTEPLEEIKTGLESLLETLPSTVSKALANLETSVQTVVVEVL